MALVIEQAGSRFTGWIKSCLSCLVPAENDDRYHHQRAIGKRGVEREMKICHSQPHLVPPMEMVADGTPPRPYRSSRSSLPSWAIEGRDRLSRASLRTSVSLNRKPTTPLRISAPSEFRKVESFFMPSQEPYSPYSPLELKIHTHGNRLSELPTFEDFQLDDRRVQPIAPPPRVLTQTQLGHSRSYRPGVSYQFLRKPVRSGSRQSSLATLDQSVERHIPLSSPLIPHFSTRIPTSIALSESIPPPPLPTQPGSNDTAPLTGQETKPKEIQPSTIPKTPTPPKTPPAPKTPTIPKTPTTSSLHERPLPPLPPCTPSTNSQHPPKTPEHIRTPSSKSSRSGRITKWLITTNKTTSQSSTPSKSDRDTLVNRTRSRTLSGSTVTSNFSNWTAGLKTTPSLSSDATTTSTARPSLQDNRMVKEFELAMSRPATSKYIFPTAYDDRPYSTIYEGQQQNQQQQLEDYEKYGYNYYAKYRESAIGLAF